MRIMDLGTYIAHRAKVVAQAPSEAKVFLSPTEALDLGLPEETGWYQVTPGNNELELDLLAVEDGRVYQIDR